MPDAADEASETDLKTDLWARWWGLIGVLILDWAVRWGPWMRADDGTTRKGLFVAQEGIYTATERAETLRLHLTLCSLGSFSESLQSVVWGALEEKYFLKYET